MESHTAMKMSQAEIPTLTMNDLIIKVKAYVKQHMARFDASHDFSHIQRVCNIAKKIETDEEILHPTVEYHSDIIELGSLLHDVGDHKYLHEGEDGKHMVEKVLIELGAPNALAQEIQAVVTHVSYSSEIKDLEKVRRFLIIHPELAVVQDADRLDALGAIGMGRCFAFNVIAKTSLDSAVEHFHEKLVRLEDLMKTETGKRMAGIRTQRIWDIIAWYDEEKALTS